LFLACDSPKSLLVLVWLFNGRSHHIVGDAWLFSFSQPLRKDVWNPASLLNDHLGSLPVLKSTILVDESRIRRFISSRLLWLVSSLVLVTAALAEPQPNICLTGAEALHMFDRAGRFPSFRPLGNLLSHRSPTLACWLHFCGVTGMLVSFNGVDLFGLAVYPEWPRPLDMRKFRPHHTPGRGSTKGQPCVHLVEQWFYTLQVNRTLVNFWRCADSLSWLRRSGCDTTDRLAFVLCLGIN